MIVLLSAKLDTAKPVEKPVENYREFHRVDFRQKSKNRKMGNVQKCLDSRKRFGFVRIAK
jgi:hypothetical protein